MRSVRYRGEPAIPTSNSGGQRLFLTQDGREAEWRNPTRRWLRSLFSSKSKNSLIFSATIAMPSPERASAQFWSPFIFLSENVRSATWSTL